MSRGQIHPWISWQDTHSGFAVIVQIPAAVWRDDPAQSLVLEEARWALVLRALTFFALFGFRKELKNHYWIVFRSVVDRLRSNVRVGERGNRIIIPPLDLGARFDLDATTSMSSFAASSPSTVRDNTFSQPEKIIVIRSPSPASTVEIPSSVAVSQGHGWPQGQDASYLPSPPASAWSVGTEAEHGHAFNHELGDTMNRYHSVSLSRWKDLPLPPQESRYSMPSSVTTSESMYSTITAYETEFTLNIDIPASLHFKDNRPFTFTGTIQSRDPGYPIAGAPPTRSRS
ncbi:hypothetical protein H0H92_008521 [Tricholoma furcatifolium]|nr:hypothetical protein H0H92_008521 [Tricholoma furcatifolium]